VLNAGRCAIAVTKERGDQLVELRGKQQSRMALSRRGLGMTTALLEAMVTAELLAMPHDEP
jgi:hypothetical protein